MSRPARPEELPGDPTGGSAGGEARTKTVPGQPFAPELLRDAQRAAVDLLLFAPIGFAKRARALLPDLIREGRSTAASAKTIGMFITPIARKQGTKLLKAKVAGLTRSASPSPWQPPTPAARAQSFRADGPKAETDGPEAAATDARKRRTGPKGSSTVSSTGSSTVSSAGSSTGSAAAAEPFAGYDHLGSAAVVARLGELSPAERAAVRFYETANRNRRTILGRLDQLDPSR